MSDSPGPARSTAPAEHVLMQRVRAEFLEMPGLSLTTDQAARLWNVDRLTASLVLESLAACGFLVSRRQAYARTAV